MNLKVYSIYDVRSLVYNQPFFARANGEAVRLFQSMVNDTNRDENMISLYKSEYVKVRLSPVAGQSEKRVSLPFTGCSSSFSRIA